MEDLTFMYCPGDDINRDRVLSMLDASDDEDIEDDIHEHNTVVNDSTGVEDLKVVESNEDVVNHTSRRSRRKPVVDYAKLHSKGTTVDAVFGFQKEPHNKKLYHAWSYDEWKQMLSDDDVDIEHELSNGKEE